jgi:hypothetical protein
LLTSRVKPSKLAGLRGNLAKAQQAKYDKAAALERDNTGLGLNILAIERPDAFAKLKLGDYIRLVPAGDLASLAKKQAELHQNINQWSPDKAASSALSMFDARNPGLLPETLERRNKRHSPNTTGSALRSCKPCLRSSRAWPRAGKSRATMKCTGQR